MLIIIIIIIIIGERSELSGKVDGKLHTAVHAHVWYIYIYICVCPRLMTRECMEDFMDSTKKGKGHLRRQAMVVARLVNDEKKTTTDLKSKGKNTHVTYMVNSCQGKVVGDTL